MQNGAIKSLFLFFKRQYLQTIAHAPNDSIGVLNLIVAAQQQKPADGVFVRLVQAEDSSMALFADTSKQNV